MLLDAMKSLRLYTGREISWLVRYYDSKDVNNTKKEIFAPPPGNILSCLVGFNNS